ncbi:MAG: TlyA family RNA methyltransferase [Spirochaetes bacterium]|nr:TlyA family RNA methyltransferase [Spirochaetota bacterium]
MRLDKFLVEIGIVESRNKALQIIKKGFIKINGINILKPSFKINYSFNLNEFENDNHLNILKNDFFNLKESILEFKIDNLNFEINIEDIHVSRGYYKLKYAIEKFNFIVKDKIFLDIGASTGGFTEVLLEKGASKVIAIDSGRAQLHYKLRNNPKVFSIEKINAKYLKREDLPLLPDCFVMDVSFISVTKIILNIIDLVKEQKGIVLFKPQYEQALLSQKIIRNKKFEFIVKNEIVRKSILEVFFDWCKINGIIIENYIESPIKGGKGNIEYLILLRKD